MPRVVVGDLVTGRRITDVPFIDYQWQVIRNQPGQVSCTLPIYDPDVASIGFGGVATPGKAYLAIVEDGDIIPNAGRLAEPAYDWDEMKLKLAAPGIRTVLRRRTVLPPAAASADPSRFIVPDPADPTKTIPNPEFATALAGMDHGSIGFSIVRQALSWPGGSLPIAIPSNRPGTRTESWNAIELKKIDEALANLTAQEVGPDFAFPPRFQTDRLGIEWAMEAGTEAQPIIRSNAVHRIDFTVKKPSARRLEVRHDIDRMGSMAWVTGGRSADRALVSRTYDPYIIDAGYPLQEIIDTSHSDVSDLSTLASYGAGSVRQGRTASQFWTFEVTKEDWARKRMTIGDQCLVIIRGDPYAPDGDHLRDIAAMAGDNGDFVKITTAEV